MRLTLFALISFISFSLWSQNEVNCQGINNTLRIVYATYPFDNHTLPKNFDLILDDLQTRIRSNTVSNSDLAVTIELIIENCGEIILLDTLMVENLKPLRDTTLIFSFDEKVYLQRLVPNHCESFAFGGWPYGKIDYLLNYRVFQINATTKEWVFQDSLSYTFAHYPKTFSKENTAIGNFYRGASSDLQPFNRLSHHSTIFKIDSIPGYDHLDNYSKGIIFYGATIGFVNLGDQAASPIIIVIVSEYLGDGKEFDSDKFRQFNNENISNHPLLDPIAISIISDENFSPNSSKLLHIWDWLDPVDFKPLGIGYASEDCLLKEGKTYLVSVKYESANFENTVEVAFNQGVASTHKAHSIFYNEDFGLHYNYSSPYHPVIRLYTLLKNGVCLELISNTNEVVDIAEDDIFIYPNPANDWLRISVNTSPGLNRLSIFSTDGKNMINASLDKNTKEQIVDVSSLNSGFYIVEFYGNEKIIRKPLIIKPF